MAEDTLHNKKIPETGNYCKADDKLLPGKSKPMDEVVITLFTMLTLGVILRAILKNCAIPYTVILLILGAIVGVIADATDALDFYFKPLVCINPNTILYIFLPILIFESAFALDLHILRRSFGQVMLMATLGLALATIITGVFCQLAFPYWKDWPKENKKGHESWCISLMFGSLLSATDPVAVVALLKELGASKVLGTVIEGESLLNDGAAIVFFEIFKDMDETLEEENPALHIFIFAVKMMIGTPIFGYFMGLLTVFALNSICDDGITEILITIISAYLTYYIGGELLTLSGVIATVVLGVVVNANKTCITPSVESSLHHFWEIAVYMANTLVFILAGLIIAVRGRPHEDEKVQYAMDLLWLMALYGVVIVARLIVVVSMSPILVKCGYGLLLNDAIIIWWGGLRGAVSLVLSLEVQLDKLDNPEYQSKIGARVLFHCAGIVALTLCVNATTVGPIMGCRGMNVVEKLRLETMQVAIQNIQKKTAVILYRLKRRTFTADANWEIIERFIEVKDPYEGLHVVADGSSDSFGGYRDTVKRFLKIQKTTYKRQYKEGILGATALYNLQALSDTAIDDVRLVDPADIATFLVVGKWYLKMQKYLIGVVSSTTKRILPPPNSKVLLYFYNIVISSWFDHVSQGLIFMNIVPCILEIIIEQSYGSGCQNEKLIIISLLLTIVNYTFFALYFLEVVFRLIGERKYYFNSYWNYLDMLVLTISLMDVIGDIVSECEEDVGLKKVSAGFPLARMFRFLKTVRIIRSVRGLKTGVIHLHKALSNIMNNQLSIGFDMAHTQLEAENNSADRLKDITEDEDTINMIRQNVTENRIELQCSLDRLEVEYPGIAISLKTRQASRLLINEQEKVIETLCKDGALAHYEYGILLKETVQARLFQYQKIPPSLEPLTATFIIESIRWLRGNKYLLKLIIEKIVKKNYNMNELIMSKSLPANGIFIINRGFVDVSMNEQTQKWGQVKSVGSILGELEFLNSLTADAAGTQISDYSIIPYSTKAVATTDAELYHIDGDILLKCMKKDNTFRSKLWLNCAMREGGRILLETQGYQGWSVATSKEYMASIESVTLEGSSYNVEANIGHLVLIHGVVTVQKARYEAPCLITPKMETVIKFGTKDKSVIKLFKIKKQQEFLQPTQEYGRASTDLKYELT